MDSGAGLIKAIVHSIEEYYEGRPMDEICAEHQIEQYVFESWLAEYKYIVLQIMELKLENRQLRKMYVDLLLLQPPRDKQKPEDTK